MNPKTCGFLIVSLLFATGSLHAQEIKSPAELMPAKVWAYGELREVGRFAEEIQKLFAGSMLGDVPRSLDKLRDKIGRPARMGVGELAALSFFLAPEMARELKNIQGVGAAFTGIDASGEPKFLIVVLPGKSNIAPLAMRIGLTAAPMRLTETIERVPVYRPVNLGVRKVGPENGKGDVLVAYVGPAFAMAPGAMLIGSPDLVKDAILRLKGKNQEDSLAQNLTFQDAIRDIENHPGLVAFSSPSAILSGFKISPQGGGPIMFINIVGQLIGTQTLRGAGYGLSLDKGTLRFQEVALLDKNEKSPLLEVLPSRPVDPSLLNFAPRDAIFAAAISNIEGEKRYEKALDLADNVIGPILNVKPSEIIQQLEKQAELDVGKDVIGKITGIAVAMGDPLKAPIRRVEEKGPNFHRVSVSPEVPLVIILQAEDEAAAKELEKLAPRVIGLIHKRQEDPKTKKVAGQTIHEVKLARSESMFYGRKGSTLVLGPFANPVAQALVQGGKKQGLLTQPRLAARAKELDDGVALLLVRPVGTVMLLMGVSGGSVEMRQSSPPKAIPDFKKDQKHLQRQPAVEPAGDEKGFKKDEIVPRGPEEEKMMKQFSKILELEDWFILRVARKDDRILYDGRAPNLDKVVPRVIDFFLEQWLRFQEPHERPFKVIAPEKKIETPK